MWAILHYAPTPTPMKKESTQPDKGEGEQLRENPNSIGELMGFQSGGIPTHPDKVYRSVRGAAALEDLQACGLVRNRQSAEPNVNSRWGDTVFWSRGVEGKHHILPEGSFVIEAPYEIATKRVVRREDVTAIYSREGDIIRNTLESSKVEIGVSNKDTLVAQYERIYDEIVKADLGELGFSAEEIEKYEKFEQRLRTILGGADGSAENLLNFLTQQDVAIIKNSHVLKGQQSTKAFIGNLIGAGTRTNALFATRDQVQAMQADFNPSEITTGTMEELKQAEQHAGAVFLTKTPTSKSVFHEGAHAIQLLEGMDMTTVQAVNRLKRELEVNKALITLKHEGLLQEVSRGNIAKVGKSAFGEVLTVHANDIYQEVDYYKQNKEQLLMLKIKLDRAAMDETAIANVTDTLKKL